MNAELLMVRAEDAMEVLDGLAGSGRTVLVVDDEPDILESVKEALELEHPGTHVVTVQSAPDAMRYLQTQHVDLIITDYRMPGMTGIDMASVLRRAHPDTPFFLITGHNGIEVVAEATQEARIDHVFAKPLDLERFTRSVGSVLSRPRISTRSLLHPLTDGAALDPA